ncbi:MAG: membrane protein insertase YidC [Proteobacteria bacterium]|nr:membrane protein insertase YidC [Pseudomonadota bacterium]
MVNQRVFLWLALAAVLFLNYQTWMHDYPPAAMPAAATTSSAPSAAGGTLADAVPSIAAPSAAPAGSATSSAATTASNAAALSAAVPTPGGTVVATSNSALAGAAAPGVATPASKAPLLHVRTDVLDLDISLAGGELVRSDLLAYPLHKDDPNLPVRLFDDSSEDKLYVLQSGLAGGGSAAAPDHRAIWQAPTTDWKLANGAAELRVPLSWSDGNGLTVIKTFVFKRGSYAIDLVYDVHNSGAAPRSLASYLQFLRHWVHPSRSYFDVETYSFKGPAIYDGHKYRRLNVEKAEDAAFSQSVTNGWLASMQHHFVSAIVPHADQAYQYQLRVSGNDYLLGATGPTVSVAPGGSAQFRETLFTGPKLQSQLAATGPELDRTADYGSLTIIARPLFMTLKWVHAAVGNWGWAIIIVTALIKLLFYPLSQASGRSMARMRAVAPRMKQIQETYKDDREKLGRAMMELYKREKINPVAGCLPMLVQIPFFISFYWVLLESVEMRQAPFMLWVNDLSARDPYFVLPLIMGAAMFAQFKLNPPPPDPMQAKVMQFMPLVMTGMMAWFPAGLVLYWITNTVLSIAQQWRINEVVAKEAAKLRS